MKNSLYNRVNNCDNNFNKYQSNKMKKITHWERIKHKGGPLNNQNVPQKSGVALCGIMLDENNIKSVVKENINCIDCLKNKLGW